MTDKREFRIISSSKIDLGISQLLQQLANQSLSAEEKIAVLSELKLKILSQEFMEKCIGAIDAAINKGVRDIDAELEKLRKK
ncbi:MAG: hypothetical protein WC471_03235 [Candidatus Woesearchaeota archaeon]